MAKINLLQDLPVSFFIYQATKYSNTACFQCLRLSELSLTYNLVALARFHAVKLKKEHTLTEKE